LNPAQYEAVTLPPGPILVVAGAGSGKTRVLTHRLAYLVSEIGASPFEVLAITFTNKAAGEMRERVAELVGSGRPPHVGLDLPRRVLPDPAPRGDAAGLPAELHDLRPGRRAAPHRLGASRSQHGPEALPSRQLHAQISTLKNELVLPAEYAQMAVGPAERRISEVYTEYQRRLADASAVDFDDLLVLVVRLFREHPEALERYRKRFQHVLVDEFQDTNAAQWELVRSSPPSTAASWSW
jgi:DNA helicase-2/ATP-dependent DNA helicase PcrA